MKRTILFTAFIMLLSISQSKIAAQDSFGSFEVFNRVILIAFADTIDQEAKSDFLQLFKGMSKKIEDVEWVHIAELTRSSSGFDHAITITFASKKGLEEYEVHEDHLKIQKIGKEIVKDYALYEYWDKIE